MFWKVHTVPKYSHKHLILVCVVPLNLNRDGSYSKQECIELYIVLHPGETTSRHVGIEWNPLDCFGQWELERPKQDPEAKPLCKSRVLYQGILQGCNSRQNRCYREVDTHPNNNLDLWIRAYRQPIAITTTLSASFWIILSLRFNVRCHELESGIKGVGIRRSIRRWLSNACCVAAPHGFRGTMLCLLKVLLYLDAKSWTSTRKKTCGRWFSSSVWRWSLGEGSFIFELEFAQQ